MSRHIITSAIIFAAGCLAASAQTVVADTIAVFDNSEQVTIVIDPDGTRRVTATSTDGRRQSQRSVTVTSADTGESFIDSPFGWDINRLLTLRRQRRRQRVYTDGAIGIYAGGVVPGGDHFPVTGGWEIGVKNLICGVWSAGSGLPSVSLGAGFGWRVMTVGHGNVLDCTDGILTAVPAPAGTHDHHSNLKHFHFTVPLTVNLPIHRSFGLAVAGELHLNTYTTASTSWLTADGVKESGSFKGLHQRMATIDWTATLGWRDAAGVYVTWAPMRPWKSGYGPQYTTFSIGGILNF